MFRHSPFDRALPPLTYKCPSGRSPVAATRRHCHDRRGDDVRADRFGSRRLAPRELAAWMARRGLLFTDSKITAEMFDTALELRAGIRAYLACDPRERAGNKEAARSLNAAMRSFPLVVKAADQRGAVLRPCRDDALSGLSVVAAELYDGAIQGTLDRLKMCAAEECRRVFFDRSKPATRRWCTSTLCGNRMKTRTYRERRSRAG